MSDRVFAIIVKIFRLISKTPATERIIPIRNKIFMIHRQCHFTIDSEGKFNNSEIINLDISSKMYIYTSTKPKLIITVPGHEIFVKTPKWKLPYHFTQLIPDPPKFNQLYINP